MLDHNSLGAKRAHVIGLKIAGVRVGVGVGVWKNFKHLTENERPNVHKCVRKRSRCGPERQNWSFTNGRASSALLRLR